MGLFDFFKSSDKKESKIDLTDFKFLSDDHIRIENGKPTNATNKGAWRGIRVKTTDNKIFNVTMYNMNGNHPVWGDNIQMAEKRMKIIENNNSKIVLRGFGTDAMGASFSDYGLTLHKSNNIIDSVTLHMHDRNVDIEYKKAQDVKHSEALNEYSEFDNFKNFIQRWNTTMSMPEKMQIAGQSDEVNNRGANAYRNDDITSAISFFEQAIKLMPNNDDALKNLIICYGRNGNQMKVDEMQRRLDYLR
ncbi:tetratricopeptide repeat protein [Flavobacterium tegetincola]|uniref:tetratricopeptide repeat protein n=1 Tax=Flavobacterium tegetincola TaxID=150172 RepID=UPI000422AD89|nr:tetratricopeptide repeat protein [Flavobacterium tegetincola]